MTGCNQVIKEKNEVIQRWRRRLAEKFEGEEEEVSSELGNIAQKVAMSVQKNTCETDISNLHPILSTSRRC